MYRRILQIGFAWIANCCLPVFAVETDEAASLIRAFCTNVAAIRSFDVLLQREAISDIVGDSVARETSHVRLRIDLDTNRYMCAANRRVVEESFAKGKAIGPIRKIRLSGCQWSGTQGWQREFPEQIEPLRSYEDGLATQDVPDLRHIGLTFFPSMIRRQGSVDVLQNWMNTRLTAPLLTTLGRSSESTAIVFRNKFKEYEGLELKQAWDFDLRKMVPIRLDRRIIDSQDGTAKEKPQEFEKLDWEERKGIFVPVRILGERIATKGEIVYSTETTTYIHWLKLNEPLEDAAFAKDWIASEKGLMEVTNPKKNGVELKVEL